MLMGLVPDGGLGAVLADPAGAQLDVASVQAALVADNLDAWLLYDFHGSNPIAADVVGIHGRGGHLATRRWYYLIPARGVPRALVHRIERHVLAHLPGNTQTYAGYGQLQSGLRQLVAGVRRVAMEYSPGCAIPYISRVDAGTLEQIRELGVEVVSSGDLVQRFSAAWDASQIASHKTASDRLYRVKDRALETLQRRSSDGTPTTEYDLQQLMVDWLGDESLVSDSPPMVSVGEHAGNPHYMPTAVELRTIRAEEVVLLDLWAKLDVPRAVFADITWMAYTGSRVPDRVAQAFAAVRTARDAAIALVQERVRTGQAIRGWEVDRAATGVLEDAGYANAILHRTGHSLGESVHGNGVNMDDYETHDDRRLIRGTGFTIEPGVYFDDFGVRSEINMVVGSNDAVVSGPLQEQVTTLA